MFFSNKNAVFKPDSRHLAQVLSDLLHLVEASLLKSLSADRHGNYDVGCKPRTLFASGSYVIRASYNYMAATGAI